METNNFLNRFIEPFIISRFTLQQNSYLRYALRDLDSVHKKGLQSVRHRTTVTFSTYVREQICLFGVGMDATCAICRTPWTYYECD